MRATSWATVFPSIGGARTSPHGRPESGGQDATTTSSSTVAPEARARASATLHRDIEHVGIDSKYMQAPLPTCHRQTRMLTPLSWCRSMRTCDVIVDTFIGVTSDATWNVSCEDTKQAHALDNGGGGASGRYIRSRPSRITRIAPISSKSESDAAPLSSASSSSGPRVSLLTCRQCKKPFDPSENHSRACRYHTAHWAGETKRKFESVYVGGTSDTSDGGLISQYWHCCGSSDPTDPGCEASPHMSYDD